MQVRPSRYWIETVWNGFGLLQYLVSSMKRFETISDYIVIIITIINIYIYTHTWWLIPLFHQVYYISLWIQAYS